MAKNGGGSGQAKFTQRRRTTTRETGGGDGGGLCPFYLALILILAFWASCSPRINRVDPGRGGTNEILK